VHLIFFTRGEPRKKGEPEESHIYEKRKKESQRRAIYIPEESHIYEPYV